MPLVMVSGFPSSGKTTRANQLADTLRETGRKVTIINNESLGIDRNSTYKESQSEKNSRGSLKAAVERALEKDSILIADDLNYIKGYRYELFCIARALGTTCCTIHVDATIEQIQQFNGSSGAYDTTILAELPLRYERPNDRNRWERPLFVVRPEDESLPIQDIISAIDGQGLSPNLATVPQPVSGGHLLHEIDTVTNDILAAVQQRQSDGVAAGSFRPPQCSRTFALSRFVPVAELRRIKRQYMKVITDGGQLPATAAQAADVFMDFLIGQLPTQ